MLPIGCLWQLVYFNFSIAALDSFLLEVVAMFFCAPCRLEFYVRASRFTEQIAATVWSAVKVRRVTSDSCVRGSYRSWVRFAMNVRENGPR